ncbi:hypothetical protein DFS34DRAFT_180177 [Phlyctochytrium arcticum]|nr:hypothetical protein DFS34DRAFT_180177 [Phlyctochytrium arcticum]
MQTTQKPGWRHPVESLVRFKNAFSATSSKTLYSHLRVDAAASVKLRSNELVFAVPHPTGNINIFPVYQNSASVALRVETNVPLTLVHARPIQDLEFSSLDPLLLATCARSDPIVRLWKIPADISPQPGGRVVETPIMFLAGHEKKVETMRFHPTAGSILVTSSSDSSIRFWDVVNMQEQLLVNCPDMAFIQSLTFDYYGNTMAGAASDSTIYLYDARAQPHPVYTVKHLLYNVGKPCRVCWLTPDNLLLSSGVNKSNARSIALWDTRNLDQPVQMLELEGSGVGAFQLHWDSALPLLFLTTKSEGIRLFELGQQSLTYVNTFKIDGQATALELLPKITCNTSKCEVARFLTLGTNNAIDVTGIHIPRTQGETIFQTDLYPPIPMVDPKLISNDWFKSHEAFSPVMVDVFEPWKLDPGGALPGAAEILPSGDTSTMAESTIVEEMLARRATTLNRKSNTARRVPTRAARNDAIASLEGTGDFAKHANESSTLCTPHGLFSGYVEIEKRWLFGNITEKHFLVLNRTRLYVLDDKDADSPSYQILLSSIKRVTPVPIGQDRGDGSHQVGLVIESAERVLHLRMQCFGDKDKLLGALRSLIIPQQGAFDNLPSLPRKEPPVQGGPSIQRLPSGTAVQGNRIHSAIGSKEGAVLLGTLEEMKEILVSTKRNCVWELSLVVLDDAGALHFYEPNMKTYTQHKLPAKTLLPGAILAVRPFTASHADFEVSGTVSMNVDTVFQINTSKQKYIFQARNVSEAANWIVQIRRVMETTDLLPISETIMDEVVEGWVQVTHSSKNGPSPGKFWLEVCGNAFFYFSSPYSLTPLFILGPTSGPNGLRVIIQKHDMPIVGSSPNMMEFTVTSRCLAEDTVVYHSISSKEDNDLRDIRVSQLQSCVCNLASEIGMTEEIYQDELKRARKFTDENRGDMDQPGIVVLDEKKIESGEQNALIGVFGKVKILFSGVECHIRSLKNDGSFVLDVGHTLYHWHGTASSRVCRACAMDIATKIRKGRSNRPRVLLVEPEDRDMLSILSTRLGGTIPRDLPVSDMDIARPLRIFKIRKSRLIQRRAHLVFEGLGPSRSLLTYDHVYILITYCELFLWIGIKADREDRRAGYTYSNVAARWLQKSLDGRCVIVRRENSDRESVIWKEKFSDYEGSLPISVLAPDTRRALAPTLSQPAIDVLSLLRPSPLPSHLLAVPDADPNYLFTLYRVDNFKTIAISPDLHGQFFSEASYVSLFTYRPSGYGSTKCISYFWQGKLSTVTQKGASALLTIGITEGVGDVQHVRVSEGKEPKHFCGLFGTDGLITRLGSDLETSEEAKIPTCNLLCFQVYKVYDENICKTIQVELRHIALHSNHCHVFVTPAGSIVWLGQHCTQSETATAHRIAEKFKFEGTSVSSFEEGPSASDALRSIYDVYGIKVPRLMQLPTRIYPRMFSCFDRTGFVQIEEIPMFTQDDLDPNTVMILDAFSTIYVWFGPLTKVNEKVIGMETAMEYLKQSKIHDKLSTALEVTFADEEPQLFERQFHGWTRRRFSSRDKPTLSPRTRPLPDVLAEYKREVYTATFLLGDSLPEHLDRTKLEQYLSEEEFLAIFKMTRLDYNSLPPWKRDKIKKSVDMF